VSLIPNFSPALLVLANGAAFKGVAVGAQGVACGEVIFNTAMTGYQEILTDPSYARQIVTMTYPHIGNVGCNEEDFESAANHAAGLVIRDLPLCASSWRAEQSLSDYLKKHGIVAIAGIDTRQLTRLLRDQGTQSGCIIAGEIDEAKALAMAQSFPGLAGIDLAKAVSTKETYTWDSGSWTLENGYGEAPGPCFNVVVYDFGVKRSLLRILASRGCRLTVVPAQTPASEVLALNPDGVFLSNGPGDPEQCTYAIEAIRAFMAEGKPLFGLCLGHQLLALAAGCKTTKMRSGHHGANHPVKDLDTGQVLITSQNHCFAVDADSLPENVRKTHISLFDGSLQGIALTDTPAFSFQGYPAANPDRLDSTSLFDRFLDMMTRGVAALQTEFR